MNPNVLVTKYAPTACQGILLAVGMSGAVIFGVAIESPELSPFAAFGAMIAMHITPRHGVEAKIGGALAGCLFVLLAASLSAAVAGLTMVALLLLFGLSWLAALPKKNLAYLGFVAKCAATAVLLSYFDFTPSLPMALYFCSGILFGIMLSLAAMAFEREDEPRPLDQVREFLHGDMNNPYASLIIPITVVASSLIAKSFSYSNPAWVGLTVIFVADANGILELRRLSDRVAGTIAGAFISFLILSHFQDPLRLALIVASLAFFMPFMARWYSLFSLIMTCMVLVLINIAMIGHGGDMKLLLWRCIDTILGCVCVLASHFARLGLEWCKKHMSHA